MDKKGIIVSGLNTALNKHSGRELNDIVIQQISKDIEHTLNKILKENYIFEKHFPVKYENEMGVFEINSDGKVFFAPRVKKEYICLEIKIDKNEKSN